MDNLKLSLFDLFAYVLPGIVILLIAIIFFDTNLVSLKDFGDIFKDISVSTGLAILVASYILGSAIDTPASMIYYKVGCRFWGIPYDKKEAKRSIATERALVQHFSPENHTFIQTWKVIKTMSHNLSFSILMLGIICIIKLFYIPKQHYFEWIVCVCISFMTSAIFLHRATIFDKWYYRDLWEAVRSLQLEELASKEIN